MKVMLIAPPSTIIAGRFKSCMPPLGLGYLASVLEQEGHVVNILDCAIEGADQESREGKYLTFGLDSEATRKRIARFEPDVVGISCLFSVAYKNVARVARVVKENWARVPVIIGGHHPSALPEEILKDHNIDYAVIGEAEYSFRDLLEAVTRHDLTAAGKIDGLAYRDERDQVVVNPKQKYIENLDDLPMPAWHLFNMESYFRINLFHNPAALGSRVVPLITSRGCPFRCIFCASTNLWNNRFRGRSVSRVLDEIAFLKNTYHIDEIQFEDDNMTCDRARSRDLFDGMVNRKFNLRWCAPQGIRVDTLDLDLCRRMRKSGCYEVTVGIESGNQRVLDQIVNKKLRLEKVLEGVRFLQKAGIRTNGFFVVGFPGETKTDMEDTFRFARRLRLDNSFIMAASPLPGTELYRICKEKNYLSKDFDIYKSEYSFSCITTPDFTPEDVTRIVGRNQILLNLVFPFLRNPFRFVVRFFLFFWKKPKEVFNYLALFAKNSGLSALLAKCHDVKSSPG